QSCVRRKSKRAIWVYRKKQIGSDSSSIDDSENYQSVAFAVNEGNRLSLIGPVGGLNGPQDRSLADFKDRREAILNKSSGGQGIRYVTGKGP
ncbi:hypothetical protein, partial [Paraburkholderia sp. SIMBA_054]|uniref:hypothetical protein n=1 Tax=Paraburkholderia sp. SIMBA_054 TaxID=3085795 RepID=UPI0039785183